jgi:hypothetical protein
MAISWTGGPAPTLTDADLMDRAGDGEGFLRHVPDCGGSAAQELMLLAEHRSTAAINAQLRDASSDALVNDAAFFGSSWARQDVEVVPDMNSNGNPEIAVLCTNRSTGAILVQVRDSVTDALINTLGFHDSGHTPVDMVVLPDISGNGSPELAVLATRNSDQRIYVQVRDIANYTTLGSMQFMGPAWVPEEMVALPDVDASGYPDLAVLVTHGSDGRIYAEVRDSVSGSMINNVPFFSGAYTPVEFMALPDMNASGNPELAVLVTRNSDQRIYVQLKDSVNDAWINESLSFFGPVWTPLDMVALPDMNASGDPELAVLVRHSVDNRIYVQILDAVDDAFVNNTVFLGVNWAPISFAVVDNIGGSSDPEIAVLFTHRGDDRILIWQNDSSSDAFVNYTVFLGNNWAP